MSSRRGRVITRDEWIGMQWWNALREVERARWLARASSAVPAEAWGVFKRERVDNSEEAGA